LADTWSPVPKNTSPSTTLPTENISRAIASTIPPGDTGTEIIVKFTIILQLFYNYFTIIIVNGGFGGSLGHGATPSLDMFTTVDLTIKRGSPMLLGPPMLYNYHCKFTIILQL